MAALSATEIKTGLSSARNSKNVRVARREHLNSTTANTMIRFITRYILGLPCTAQNMAQTNELLRRLGVVASQLLGAILGFLVAWLFTILVFSL